MTALKRLSVRCGVGAEPQAVGGDKGSPDMLCLSSAVPGFSVRHHTCQPNGALPPQKHLLVEASHIYKIAVSHPQ